MTRQDILMAYPEIKYSPGKNNIGSYVIPMAESFRVIGETTPENDMKRIESILA